MSDSKKVEEVVPSLMLEMLKELRGIKEAVTLPGVNIDMGSDKALIDFLSTPKLSMAELIDGLGTYFTKPRAEGAEKTTFDLGDWLGFTMRNPDKVKEHLAKFGPVTYECLPVTSKAAAIEELTKILKGEVDGLQLLPSMLLFSLPAKDREDILKLINPKATIVDAGNYRDDSSMSTGDLVLETLLNAIEEGTDKVNFIGLSALTIEDRAELRDKLIRARAPKPIRVAGGMAFSLTEGLVNALKQPRAGDGSISIEGIDNLSHDDTCLLINLLEARSSEDFYGGRPGSNLISYLIKALDESQNSIVFRDVTHMDSGVRRSLMGALKQALQRFDELESIRKGLLANGPKTAEQAKPKNVPLTLNLLASELCDNARGQGIEIDETRLLNHLLTSVVVANLTKAGLNEEAFRTASSDGIFDVAGHACTFRTGDYLIDFEKDNVVKITSRLQGSPFHVVTLDKSGGVKIVPWVVE